MNSFIPSPGFDARRFKGTTLILPSVSIGNVPQLTTDLLLSTLKLDRVGCIEDENVVPVLGAADRPHSKPTTIATAGTGITGVSGGGLLSLAVEVFQSKDGKWTLIQQRSPTVSHRSHHYADNLVRFIQDSEFDQVVLLASADGARRIDIQLRSGNPDIQLDDPSLTSSSSTTTTSAQKTLEKVPRIPNGGFARRLHSLCQESGIAILTVVAFAMEGDNAPDAIFLANVLNAILRVHNPTEQQVRDGEGEWKVPKSWDSLYGNSHHQDMYQ
ncbi:PAC2 family-domain-containing protein [Linnemannia elongata]|nr:PAC2 family-domain-containing protein [Linnemannia elongata]